MDYLLDTNIILTYARMSAMADAIEKDLKLFENDNLLAVSVVTVGELRSLAKQFQYGVDRIKRIQKMLSNLLVVDINIEEIIEQYAEIDAYSQGKLKEKPLGLSSRNMGKNDLWIAATSSTYNLTLVTTDQDFEHLESEYLTLHIVDLDSYKDI